MGGLSVAEKTAVAEAKALRKAEDELEKKLRKEWREKRRAEKEQKKARIAQRLLDRKAHKTRVAKIKLRQHYEKAQDRIDRGLDGAELKLKRAKVLNRAVCVQTAPGMLKLHLPATEPPRNEGVTKRKHVELDTSNGKLILRVNLSACRGTDRAPTDNPEEIEAVEEPEEMVSVLAPTSHGQVGR